MVGAMLFAVGVAGVVPLKAQPDDPAQEPSSAPSPDAPRTSAPDADHVAPQVTPDAGGERDHQGQGTDPGETPAATPPSNEGGEPAAAAMEPADQASDQASDQAGDQASPQSTGGGDTDAAPASEGPPTEATPSNVVPATICEGKAIARIEVTGNGRVSADDIRASIGLRPGLPCTDREVNRDARALWDLGYFNDVQVEAEVKPDGQLALTFRVTERPAIGEVVFEGNDEVDKSDLEEKVTLRQGSVLSEPKVAEQLGKIRELYAEKGFFLAKIKYELDSLPNDEARVRFVIDEGTEVTVRRIRFLGNKNIEDGEIKGYMQTGETSIFSLLSSNNTYRREVFDQDLNMVQALYYDRGYLLVEVAEPLIELTPDRKHIDLTIRITEGPRFRVGRVKVGEINEDGEPVDPLPGRKFLRESVELNPGDWFSRSTIAENLQTITRYYRDQGYAKVQVTPQTELNTDERIVHIGVSVRRGPLVYVQRINFGGNTKTRDAVMRRELRIAEGDLYSQTLVERSKERINALGFFESVDVAEEPGATEDRIVLAFQVAERPTGTFQLGAGFSSQETFLLTGQIQQQNLFGRGQSLSLNMQFSGIRQLAQVRFVEPYLYGTQWTMAADVFKMQQQLRSFNRDSTGFNLTFGHPIFKNLFDDHLRLFASYRLEEVDISPATGGLIGSGGGLNFQLFRFVPLHNLFRKGLTSSLRLSLQWDSRDNRLFPKRGVFATASAEIADELIGSNTDFVRHRLNYRFYHKVFWELVFKVNLEWGLITSSNAQGVPVFERYFLGGIQDVRGFRLQALGPRLGIGTAHDPTTPPSRQGIPFGGNMQAFYNLELEFPIVEAVGIRGVLFQDAGNAWNMEDRLCGPDPSFGDAAASSCDVDLTRLRTSVGFGFRWFSPLGPLRFEWGFPFEPRRPFENTYEFMFTVGNAF